MPEVQDSVSLAQVSNTPCASQPPSSDLGTGLHLGVNQTPSFSALCNPQIASRPLADWLLNRSPNGPYKPYPVSPDNSPNMSCTWFFSKKCLWTEPTLEQARNLTKLAFHGSGRSFPLAEAELLCRKMLFPTKLSLWFFDLGWNFCTKLKFTWGQFFCFLSSRCLAPLNPLLHPKGTTACLWITPSTSSQLLFPLLWLAVLILLVGISLPVSPKLSPYSPSLLISV